MKLSILRLLLLLQKWNIFQIKTISNPFQVKFSTEFDKSSPPKPADRAEVILSEIGTNVQKGSCVFDDLSASEGNSKK